MRHTVPMSYLDRIAECNDHDLTRYVPFAVGGQRVGWVRRDRLTAVAQTGNGLLVADDGVALAAELESFEARSAAMSNAIGELTRVDEISAWRGELYPVATAFAAVPLLQMERAAIPYFGARAYGIHVNGYVRDGDEIRMWIARRARDKPTYPGMLDNMVAGGQPIGLSLWDNVIKEAAEEAAIPGELAARAQPVGAVTYCAENEGGLKPDCMFCYDLELPADFEPQCADGEVEAFELWPLARVAEVVRESAAFKFNCNLVIVDFLVRHGWIPADDPDYVEIVRRLRALDPGVGPSGIPGGAHGGLPGDENPRHST